LLPAAIAITANGRTADVLSEGGTVMPIATATNKRGRAINAGISPIRIAVAPIGRTVYVLDSPVLPAVGTAAPTNDGSVIPIATAPPTSPRKRSPSGSAPRVRDHPNGGAIYANTVAETVTPIATATSTAGRPISVGNASPLLIAITLNGQTAKVANVGPQQRRTVTPIATATNKAARAIPVGRNPAAIAITPNGRTVCVANALADG
jgi:DNA-binding beta-propeller fold protein YncE